MSLKKYNINTSKGRYNYIYDNFIIPIQDLLGLDAGNKKYNIFEDETSIDIIQRHRDIVNNFYSNIKGIREEILNNKVKDLNNLNKSCEVKGFIKNFNLKGNSKIIIPDISRPLYIYTGPNRSEEYSNIKFKKITIIMKLIFNRKFFNYFINTIKFALMHSVIYEGKGSETVKKLRLNPKLYKCYKQ